MDLKITQRISHREKMGVVKMGAILRATWGWEVEDVGNHHVMPHLLPLCHSLQNFRSWHGIWVPICRKNSNPYDCHNYRIMFP